MRSGRSEKKAKPDASVSRCKFLVEEDLKLRSLVDALGTRSWTRIGCFMPGRTARQCRDRYNNYLADSLFIRPWTPREDAILLERYRAIGPKWVEISKLLKGRSGNCVKNRWYKHLKKGHDRMPHVATAATGSASDPPTEPIEEPPAVEEHPNGGQGQDVGIGDCHWEQILSSREKDAPFDSLWTHVFSIGEHWP
jgi:hypothetical protein